MEHSAEGIAHSGRVGEDNQRVRLQNDQTILNKGGIMVKFRFQDLKIWHLAIEIADRLFDIADDLERKKLFKFAEQLRAAGMSMFKT
jgi:hypothetical protein